MSKADATKMSSLIWDGAGPLLVTSGRLTNSASAQYGLAYVAPCDLYIQSIVYAIDTQFTHASSNLNMGSLTDDDAFINAVALQNVAVGTYDVDLSSASLILRRIPRGTVFAFSLDAADTTGKITATAVLVPANPV